MSLFDSRLARTKTNHTVHTNIWKTEPADVFTIDQFGFTFSTIFHALYTQFCCFSLTNIDPLESIIIIAQSSEAKTYPRAIIRIRETVNKRKKQSNTK
jgi:hypothetical protein